MLDLGFFGPDPASDSVKITLDTPTASDLSAFSATTGTSVTAAAYTTAVGGYLTKAYGPNVTVSATTTAPLTQYNRYDDYSPFWGGDEIYRNVTGGEVICTGGFSIKGNSSGNDFMLTAGHCGNGSTWYADGSNATMGNVSTGGLYYTNGGYDFETISTSDQGYVWVNSSGYHNIEGVDIPAINTDMTFDGSITGEVPNVPVVANNSCAYFGTWETCDLVEGEAAAGTTVTQAGDSGGPAYVRQADGGAKATGTVVGGNGSNISFAERIDYELSASNCSLLTD